LNKFKERRGAALVTFRMVEILHWPGINSRPESDTEVPHSQSITATQDIAGIIYTKRGIHLTPVATISRRSFVGRHTTYRTDLSDVDTPLYTIYKE